MIIEGYHFVGTDPLNGQLQDLGKVPFRQGKLNALDPNTWIAITEYVSLIELPNGLAPEDIHVKRSFSHDVDAGITEIFNMPE